MRLRQLLNRSAHEVRAIRAAARTDGLHDALVARARHHLEIDGVDTARVERLEAAVSELGERVAHAQAELARNISEVGTRLAEVHGELFDDVVALRTRADETAEHLRVVENQTAIRLAHSDNLHEQAWLEDRIAPVTAWVRRVHLTTTRRISVVTPTYNRADLLERAVESMRSQHYPHWELVVIDDGSTDRTPELLARLAAEDDRVVVLNVPHVGAQAARNTGLARATGDIVCYLDDDNTMEPLWLKGVAWAFERQPGLQMLYGARVVEGNLEEDGRLTLPYLHFEAFDRRTFEDHNLIDLGALAHLRGLPEAHFDESLPSAHDWDLALRLSETTTPLALPLVGSIYHVSAASNRITGSEVAEGGYSRVMEQMRRMVPLRVLTYVTEQALEPDACMEEETETLTRQGSMTARCVDGPLRPAQRGAGFTDLYAAIELFDPDVIVLHEAELALRRVDTLADIGIPFALRVHEPDAEAAHSGRVASHPLCVGVWTCPHDPADTFVAAMTAAVHARRLQPPSAPLVTG